MGKIISLVNQKGGVGKTTTSINLSASLAHLGKRVLLIDLDPQGNATTGVGINKGDISRSVHDVMTAKCEITEAIVRTKFKNLYVLPATINLAGIDIELLEKSKNIFSKQYERTKDEKVLLRIQKLIEEFNLIKEK